MKKLLLFTTTLCCVAVLIWFQTQQKNKLSPSPHNSSKVLPKPVNINTSIPIIAIQTWEYIKEHKSTPKGYIGGREFRNREGKLPKLDKFDSRNKYLEWDIYPKQRGKNRGAERLVSLQYIKAWYTPDHYNTFIEIK